MKLTGNQAPSQPRNFEHYFSDLNLGADAEPTLRYLVSNDAGYQDIEYVMKRLNGRTEDRMALFVGAGGMLSLLPEIRPAFPIQVDKNPAVTYFNQLLAELIGISDSPSEVIEKLEVIEAQSRGSFLMGIGAKGGANPGMYHDIEEEARVYGQDHWTNPGRFLIVKQMLADAPPTFVSADVANLNFSDALGRLTTDLGSEIGFANLTNVHHWLFRGGENMADIVRDYPMGEDGLVLYSDYFNWANRLEMSIVTKHGYMDSVNTQSPKYLSPLG